MNPERHAESPAIETALLAWRRKAIDFFLAAAAALNLPLIVLAMLGYGPPIGSAVRIVAVIVYIIVLAAAVLHWLNYRMRVLAFFISAYVLAAALNVVLPRGPYAQIGLFALPILTLVLVGSSSARIAILANIVILVSVCLLRVVPATARLMPMYPGQITGSWDVSWHVAVQICLLMGVMLLLSHFQRYLLALLIAQHRTKTKEKRQLWLERSFLHDLMNIASVLRGFAWLEDLDKADAREYGGQSRYVASLSSRIITEIESHAQLIAAEHNQLELALTTVNPLDVLDEVFAIFNNRDTLDGRTLCIDPHSQATELQSDRVLLVRVVGNMVKNAIEGSAPGEVITIGCRNACDSVEFWVHNPTYIPGSVGMQIFERPFSTKGPGRGVGTYSMKMLTEKYLSGKIAFISTKGRGTTFVASYPLRTTPPLSVGRGSRDSPGIGNY